MADINALTNQSEHKAEALTLEADHILDSISKIHDQSVALTTAIDHAAQQAHQHFSTLSSKLMETEQHLTRELQSSKEQWETLYSKVSQLEQRVDTAMNEMKTQLNTIKAQIAQATTEIDQEFHTTQDQLGKVSHQAHDLESHAISCRDTEIRALEDFQGLLGTTQSNFDQHKAVLLEHLSALERDAKTHLGKLIDELGQLEQESDRHLADVHNALNQSTQDVLQDLNHKFTVEFPSEFSNAGQAVDQAMTALHDTGVDKLNLLEGKFGDIFGKVDEFAQILEKIKPILEEVAQFA